MPKFHMPWTVAIGALLAASLSPATVLAQTQAQAAPATHAAHAEPSRQEHSFADLDTDKDGRISRSEFAAGHSGKDAMFPGIDRNGDGFIGKDEFDAHHTAMGNAMGSHDAAASDEHAGHH